MLNKDHGDPLPFPKTVYPLYHLNTLFGPHARRGLVERQQAGFKSKSQAYIQQFLFPVRKMSGHNIRIPQSDHFHQFTRSITHFGSSEWLDQTAHLPTMRQYGCFERFSTVKVGNMLDT